jgi:hypothetical protein
MGRLTDLGYYDVDSPRYGDFFHEVTGHTNTYYAWARRGYQADTEEPFVVWAGRMKASVKRPPTPG